MKVEIREKKLVTRMKVDNFHTRVNKFNVSVKKTNEN